MRRRILASIGRPALSAKSYVQDGLLYIEDETFETLETKKYAFVLDRPLASDSDFTAEICCEIEDDGTSGVGTSARMLIGKNIFGCLGFAWLSSADYYLHKQYQSG